MEQTHQPTRQLPPPAALPLPRQRGWYAPLFGGVAEHVARPDPAPPVRWAAESDIDAGRHRLGLVLVVQIARPADARPQHQAEDQPERQEKDRTSELPANHGLRL